LHPHDTGQLGHEEKLIDLYSKVTHIEQQMGHSKTDAAESQSNFELPSLPKQIMVRTFIDV